MNPDLGAEEDVKPDVTLEGVVGPQLGLQEGLSISLVQGWISLPPDLAGLNQINLDVELTILDRTSLAVLEAVDMINIPFQTVHHDEIFLNWICPSSKWEIPTNVARHQIDSVLARVSLTTDQDKQVYTSVPLRWNQDGSVMEVVMDGDPNVRLAWRAPQPTPASRVSNSVNGPSPAEAGQRIYAAWVAAEKGQKRIVAGRRMASFRLVDWSILVGDQADVPRFDVPAASGGKSHASNP